MIEYILSKLSEKFVDAGFSKAGQWLKSFKKEVPIEVIKRKTNVLFVDDESFDNRLNVIRESGWQCNQVTDIKNLDDELVKNSDIIFMDYKGVGTALSPTNEGIGLAKLLRRKYPKKRIIFYSGYAGYIPGDEVFVHVDGWINKHADIHEYIDEIETSARIIHG